MFFDCSFVMWNNMRGFIESEESFLAENREKGTHSVVSANNSDKVQIKQTVT